MNNDKKNYLRLLDTEWKMSQAHIRNLITWDEYTEFNKYGQEVEALLEMKHGVEVVRLWRTRG